MLQRGGSSAKSARWGGDREDDDVWAISLFGVVLINTTLCSRVLIQSPDGASSFDRPSQGGAWYTLTFPVVIVHSSLDVYNSWWDRAGEIVVLGQIHTFVWCLL